MDAGGRFGALERLGDFLIRAIQQKAHGDGGGLAFG
jgi:hypothetical protein